MANRDYKNFKGIVDFFVNRMEESFLDARDMGITFRDANDLADGIEVDMEHEFDEWLTGTADVEFDANDCQLILIDNSLRLMQLAAAAKRLGMVYKFDALDPVGFTRDLFCLLINLFTKKFVAESSILTRITEQEFKFGIAEAYIFEKEMETFKADDTRDYWLMNIVNEIIREGINTES